MLMVVLSANEEESAETMCERRDRDLHHPFRGFGGQFLETLNLIG
jgi:hypothetical protein